MEVNKQLIRVLLDTADRALANADFTDYPQLERDLLSAMSAVQEDLNAEEWEATVRTIIYRDDRDTYVAYDWNGDGVAYTKYLSKMPESAFTA